MAMAAKIAALCLAMTPAVAVAQVDWGALRPVDPMGAYASGAMMGARLRQMQAAQAEALAEAQAQENERQLRIDVGQAVAAGDCAKAREIALSAGDFSLAETAMQLCQAKPPEPQ